VRDVAGDDGRPVLDLGGRRDRTLADPECDEFLSVVEELYVPILLHPVALGQDIMPAASVITLGSSPRGERVPRAVEDYLASFYFDTVVHDARGLRLLIDVMSQDDVVLGSNYPGWDDAPIWETIRSLPELRRGEGQDPGLNSAERLFRA